MISKKKLLSLLCTVSLLISGTNGVNVNAASKMVSLSKSKVALNVGESVHLKVRSAKGVKIQRKNFTSSNKKVAVINKKGIITAKKTGKTFVKVNITYKKAGNVKKTLLKCQVTVMQTSDEAPSDPVTTVSPTNLPTINSTTVPSTKPSNTPITTVSAGPIITPSADPIITPTTTPSADPITTPISIPSADPIVTPTISPSDEPVSNHVLFTGDNLSDITDAEEPVDVTVSGNVKTVNSNTFPESAAKNIKSLTLMEGVETIDIDFIDRYWTSIYIPASVTDIKMTTYNVVRDFSLNGDLIAVVHHYRNLKEISIDEANPKYDSRNNCNAIIETASNKLIYGCDETIIPAGIKIIGDCAFHSCPKISNITIPEGVTTIESCAFALSNVKTIHLPSSVTSMENNILSFCSKLTEITVDAENSVYDSRNNCNAIIETANNKLIIGCSSSVIPEDIETIGQCAFFDCVNLESIDLPDQLKVIEKNAFLNCTSLESIDLPDQTVSIEDGAFGLCRNLQKITLPSGLTKIEARAFSFCEKLEKITIPEGVTTINIANFVGCNSLKELYFPKDINIVTYYQEEMKDINVNITWNGADYQGFSDFLDAYKEYHYSTRS